ncbi:DUF2742 domain-containing protein [Gordonia sp. HS-NH1]|uniref:DUF2742 domain-containing protein n=1 Tax=Gordonia sp. HS-NH1 TaxID=1435068 RepID=UPI0006E438FD|nr:DUF2742 domain-containing protein [Gordonia sp. HS-NH1]
MTHEIDWQPVHRFVHRLLAGVDHTGLPLAGTRGWQALDDTDPRKLAAVLCAGSRWCLEEQIAELHARRDAQKAAAVEIAAAADWSAVARRIRDRDNALRSGAHIERKAS